MALSIRSLSTAALEYAGMWNAYEHVLAVGRRVSSRLESASSTSATPEVLAGSRLRPVEKARNAWRSSSLRKKFRGRTRRIDISSPPRDANHRNHTRKTHKEQARK